MENGRTSPENEGGEQGFKEALKGKLRIQKGKASVKAQKKQTENDNDQADG